MTWPLVSRRAFVVVSDERDRLRAQVDRLLDHVTRMDRVEHGLHELPQQASKAREPMPDSLRAEIEMVGTAANRKQLEDAAYKLHGRGFTWTSIEAKLRKHRESQDPNGPSSAPAADA